ncbi:MAG: hypothetical protein KHY89_09060 [Butyricicoccus pullicaecorum]|nr:hypothetical protein [Butyricicoccus pullicaecorum]
MKNSMLSVLVVTLSLVMLMGCGRQTRDNNTANPPARTEQPNDNVTNLPNAPDNGSNVQGDKNGIGDQQKPNDGSVTQDAKNVLDDAGDMVGDAARGVGDAVQDVGDAAKNAADDMTGNKNSTADKKQK